MKNLMMILMILVIAISIICPHQAYAKEGKLIELKFTHEMSPGHIVARSIREGFEPLEAMSGGRVKLRIFGGGSLAKGVEAYDAVLGGIADIAFIDPQYWPGRFCLITVASIPAIFPNAVIAMRAINEITDTTPYIKNEFKDVKILSWSSTGLYRMCLKKKITSLQEFKGLRIRTVGGYQSKAIKRLGTTPVQMPWGEISTSVSRGLLDGVPLTAASVPVYKFHEMLNYCIENAKINTIPIGLVMNKDVWGKLPPDIKAMVTECARSWSTRTAMYFDNEDSISLAFLRLYEGFEVYSFSPEEKKKFDAAFEPLLDEWVAEMDNKGLPGTETVNSLLKIKKKLTEKWK